MPLALNALVLVHDCYELAGLEACPAFLRRETRPLGRVLARGLAVVVAVREVEAAVHPHCDKRAVGLKGYAVLVDEVILIGDIPTGARAGEVLYFADCTELTEKEGFLDGLHNEKDLMLNFSITIGKLRARLSVSACVLKKIFPLGFPDFPFPLGHFSFWDGSRKSP